MTDDTRLQPYRVDVVGFDTALAELRSVRDEVFVGEQGVPITLEHDALDPLCTHVLARLLDGSPVGTARLTPDHHIGRMAVRAAWRGRGIGDALLRALLDEARRRGWPEVRLNSQASAIGFYARHGFQPGGERFMEAGIEAAIGIIERARRTVWIRSVALDPWLYDEGSVLQALRGFATRGGGQQVLVLLHAAAAPQQAHAPLLALAQRLPSIFQVRELQDPVDRNDPAAWIAGDGGGYYLRGLGERVQGESEQDAPAKVRQLAARFDDGWQRSRPVSEYRALGL